VGGRDEVNQNRIKLAEQVPPAIDEEYAESQKAQAQKD
jgi:hypothetical protein